jgi:glycine/D-amino acid oxidase-like deaminating enzyme
MRVTVIGAGVFGAWCAKFLADAGHHVTLVDAYGPANARASSSDHSRVIRAGYGGDEIYSRWASQSLRDWQWLAATTNQTLLARTGALFLGEPDSGYVRDTHRTLTATGISAEWLEPSALAQRYPQIAVEGLGPCVYEPHAGVIRARAAVQTLVAHLMANRRVLLVTARVVPLDEQRGRVEVTTTGGAVLEADAFVFACGPWLPRVLPQAVGERVRPTRQEVLFFGPPAGDLSFSASRLPVWIDFTAGLYGIADLDARGFKVGIDRHGPVVEPDTLERVVDGKLVDETRAWIARRFPALHDAPLVDAHVCQYENTSSGDFIIDRHPAWPSSCWIVGGGSGHGFKHGPAVGRHLAALVAGEADVQERFGLATKTTAAARAVY